MICPSPNLTGGVPAELLSPDAPLRVHLDFEMDGVKDVLNVSTNLSDFTYEVDPEVTKFPGVDRVRVFHLDENYLEIQVRQRTSSMLSRLYPRFKLLLSCEN